VEDFARPEAVLFGIHSIEFIAREMRDTAQLETEPDAMPRIGNRSPGVVRSPERRPGKLLHRFAAQSKGAALLVHDPQVTLAVFDDREHVSGRHRTNRNEPITLQIPKLAVGRRPDTSPAIFE
jgi:hypothetical protein